MDTTTGHEKSKKLMNGYTKYILNFGAAGLVLYFFVYPAWDKGLSYMDTAKEELPKQSIALQAIQAKISEQDTEGVKEKLDSIKSSNDDAAAAAKECHDQQTRVHQSMLENQRAIAENQTAILGRLTP